MKLGHIRSQDARRGVVLLVVLALLTLFAVVAVTFVFFSEQEAVSASLYKDSEIRTRPDADLPFVHLLNQLTIGTNNTESALMMNDLLTNMYGTDGTVPFNGLGRRAQWAGNVRTDSAVNEGRYYQEASHGSYNPPYTYPDENFPALGAVGDPVMRNRIGDPNSLRDVTYVLFRSFVRPVWIRDNSSNPVLFDPFDPTNPDANLFWTNPALSIALPNVDATLSADDRRRMVARPGPWDHPFFPPPADAGGDVRNLPPGWTVLLPDGATEHNGNDSYWIDMGFPVQRGPDGRYFKPLAAVFMMDLDGLMNVNIHGNLFGTGNVALSNHGLGPWEVNLRRVLTANLPSTTTPEWPRVLLGSLNPPLMGRLGSPYTTNGTIPGPFASATSTSSFSWTPTVMPPYYAALDYNASRLAGGLNIPSNRLVFADPANAARQLERFPRFFPVDGYDTRSNAISNEVPASHPLFYQHFRPAGDDRVFKAHNMEALLRHGDTNTDAQYSDLRHLLSTNMSTTAYPAQPDTAPGVKARRLLTTHSYDVVRAGVTPWWYRTGNMQDYRYRIEDNNNNQIEDNELHPKGYDDSNPGSASIPTPNTAPTYPTMEFNNNSWRANIGSLPRLDLNRPLPAYPPVDAAGRIQNQEMFRVAARARQDFARDIYQRLLFVTGSDPNSVQVEEVNARRWLAQLAVNIVDQRDSDDYVTAFNFDPNNNNVNSGWVYGTELPRVVINEVFGQYIQPDPMGSPNDYRTYLWAELYNPLHADPALIEGGDARLFIPETAMGAGDSIRCYRLAVLKKSGGDRLRDKDNGLGEAIVVTDLHSYLPNNVAGSRCQVYFDNAPANARVLKPSGNYTTGEDYYHGVLAGGSTMVTDPNTGMMEQRIVPDFSQAWNYGWYMVGPNMIDPGDAAQGQKTFPVSKDATGNDREADGPIPDPLLKENTMSYHLTYQGGRTPNSDEEKPTLILQRLMCPNLPYNDDPTSDLYNNYVTIDYVQNIELHNGDVPAGMPYNAENQYSVGKKQPYASRLSRANSWQNSQYIPQEPGSFPTQNPRNQPKHTFYRHNAIEELYYNEMLPMGDRLNFGSGAATPENQVDANAMDQTLKLPFDWLTHFDREFVSALDLLQVSGYKPFEVPQEFINRDGIPYTHRAPWFANDNRLYRALEFLETRSRAAGVSTRVVRCTTQVNGAPNYRTVSLNTFNQATNPTGDAHWENNGTPMDTSDDYVWGFGDNGGIWLIRAGTTLVVEPGTAQGETVRVSAVDAVNQNLTAYFSRNHATSLTDPSGGPNYFELVVPYMAGRVPGKINLNTIFDFETFAGLLDAQNPNHFVQVSTTTNGAISTANSVNVVTPANWTMNGPNGVAWSFDIGSVLIVQPGTANQEIVEVTNIDPNNQTFEAYFTRTHPNNSTIVLDPVATMFRQMVLHRTKQAPFRSLATGFVDSGDYQFEAGLGVEHTLLRPNQLTSVPRSLFELPGNTHPWVKTEAMNKIFNNVTVRSNCFALWVTIGYFEVSSSDSYGTSDVVVNTPPQSRTVTLPNRPVDLGISVGSRVLVDTGANIESVDVTAIDNNARTFTAMFNRSHTAPFRIQGSLGREIGRADGKEIRHRYFAILDRSVFEQFTLEALMRDPVNANISLIRANQRIDPRRDNAVNTSGSTFVNLPAPVVYWSRIE